MFSDAPSDTHLSDSKRLKDKTYKDKDVGAGSHQNIATNLDQRKVENQADWFQGAGPLEGSGSRGTKVLLQK